MAEKPKKAKSPQQKRADKAESRKEWTQAEIDAAMAFPKGQEEEPGDGEKDLGGRPAKLSPSDWERIESLAAGGLTKIEIAKSVGVSYWTLHEYEKRFPEFSQAIARGRELSLERVENSMHKVANGHYAPEEKIFYDSQVGQVVRAETVKYYPPDPKAQHILLQKKETGSWRPKPEMELKFPEPLIIKSKTSGRELDQLGAQPTEPNPA